jgi:dCMP deaminase
MRPTFQETFIETAKLVATRSTCLRRKVGAVAVKDNHMLCSGYNGAPRGLPHCSDVGCLREELNTPSGERHEICRGVHAEQNLICQAAFHGVNIAGADIYCTHQPCSICAKMILNAGINIVYYIDGYPDDMTREILCGRLVKLPKASKIAPIRDRETRIVQAIKEDWETKHLLSKNHLDKPIE